MSFDYFTVRMTQSSIRFYRIPKRLITGDEFQETSTEANRELKSMAEFYKKDMVPKYDIPEL